MTMHIVNGTLVNDSGLLISARDIGFLRGYGVFDFLITYQGGKPFHLMNHIDRLRNSASSLGIEIPYSQQEIADWANTALKMNEDGNEKAIRMVVTGGIGPDSITPSESHPTILIMIEPLVPFPTVCYEEGAGIMIAEFTRYLPEAKSLNYIEGVKRMQEARRQNYIEVVYHNSKQVFEGATSNIFACIDGCLYTPKTNILKGITRKIVLASLKLPFAVEEKDFSLAELMKASEVFLSASNKEIMPITRINKTPVGDGKVGRFTKETMIRFREYTSSESW